MKLEDAISKLKMAGSNSVEKTAIDTVLAHLQTVPQISKYGIDITYFTKELNKIIETLNTIRPDRLERHFIRLSEIAKISGEYNTSKKISMCPKFGIISCQDSSSDGYCLSTNGYCRYGISR